MSNTLRNIAIITGIGVVVYLLYPKKVAASTAKLSAAGNLGNKPGEVFQGVENALDKIKAEKNALKQSAAFTGVEGNKWQDFK